MSKIPLKEIGLAGILVQPTPDLIRLQDELFDAIGKFMAPGSSGTAAAFKITVQDPEINQASIDAVANYFAAHRGEHYSPHVTIGVGTIDYLITFSAAGASAYQFGNFGTAAKHPQGHPAFVRKPYWHQQFSRRLCRAGLCLDDRPSEPRPIVASRSFIAPHTW